MLTTARRAISYPDPARTDAPDVPAHLALLAASLDVDVIYNQGTDAARIAAAHITNGGRFWWTTDTKILWYDDGVNWNVASGAVMGANIASAANITITAPSHKITGTTTITQITDSLAYAGKSLKLIFQGTIAVKHNVVNIRLQGGVTAGFVANEVLTLIYDGTNWIEDTRSNMYLSGQGGIIWNGTGNPSGMVAEDGSAISRTGFVALFDSMGVLHGVGDGSTTFNLPDSRARVDAGYAAGGHSEMATVGNKDSTTYLSRRIAHKHSLANPTINITDPGHVHRNKARGGAGGTNWGVTAVFADGDGSFDPQPYQEAKFTGISATATGGTVGPQTGSEPTDLIPYLVRPKYTRV